MTCDADAAAGADPRLAETTSFALIGLSGPEQEGASRADRCEAVGRRRGA